jgi:hypothetical protein
MTRLNLALALLSLLGGTLFVVTAARAIDHTLNARRLAGAKRWGYSARGLGGTVDPRRSTDASPPRVKNITFTNPKASGEYARVYALPRRFVSCTSRVLREW